MGKTYQVTIEGRVFEGRDHRALLKKAVEIKRDQQGNQRCRRCRRPIHETLLADYQLCFECVGQAIDWYTEALIRRVQCRSQPPDRGTGTRIRAVTGGECSPHPNSDTAKKVTPETLRFRV